MPVRRLLCRLELRAHPVCPQAKELVQTEGWSARDLQKALVQVYLRMDELLMRDEARPELEGLAGDASPTDSGYAVAAYF